MPVYHQETVTVAASAATTSSNWIPMNIHQTPFNVGFGIKKGGSGAIVMRVEHTFDNVLEAGVSATPFVHADVTAATGNVDGNYAYGVRAIRLTIVSAVASAHAEITVIQAGI